MKELLVPDPRNYNAQEILKDGTPITIRAIRKNDKASILAAFRALDPEPNPSECVKCLEGNPMLHLYSTVLLAVIAANALVVFLAIVGVMNSRKHDR
jgi:hypothetical protein